MIKLKTLEAVTHTLCLQNKHTFIFHEKINNINIKEQ